MHSIFAFYGRSAESRWYFIHEVQKCISVVHFYSTRKVLDDFFTPPTNFNHKTAPFSKVFRVVKIQLVIGSQVFLQIKKRIPRKWPKLFFKDYLSTDLMDLEHAKLFLKYFSSKGSFISFNFIPSLTLTTFLTKIFVLFALTTLFANALKHGGSLYLPCILVQHQKWLPSSSQELLLPNNTLWGKCTWRTFLAFNAGHCQIRLMCPLRKMSSI